MLLPPFFFPLISVWQIIVQVKKTVKPSESPPSASSLAASPVSASSCPSPSRCDLTRPAWPECLGWQGRACWPNSPGKAAWRPTGCPVMGSGKSWQQGAVVVERPGQVQGAWVWDFRQAWCGRISPVQPADCGGQAALPFHLPGQPAHRKLYHEHLS